MTFRQDLGNISVKMLACFMWHPPPVGVDFSEKSGSGEETTPDELLKTIADLNADPAVDGEVAHE